MRRRTALLYAMLSVLFLIISCDNKQPAASPDHSAFEKRLQILLHEGEYFKLKSELQKNKAVLPDIKSDFYKAFVESAFNNSKEAISLTESLLKNRILHFNKTARIELMMLLRDNYFKAFRYNKAAEIGRELLKEHKGSLGDKLYSIKNNLLIHEGLKNIPQQQVVLKKTALKWKRNKLGLMEIPIKTNASTFGIVFDTRAHISTVTEGFAKRLGLKMLEASFEESSGITGIKFKSRLGVADSLYIGQVLIKNVVFQVLPDEQLHFPAFNYTLDGILGFPVITQLKEIHIFRDGNFVISPVSTAAHLNNLAFDGSTTVISAVNDTDTLSFHFDTGATGTEFYSNYFSRFEAKVKSIGKAGTVKTGGAGGSKKAAVYTLPIVNLTIGQKKIQLKDIPVRTEAIYKGQKYNGNIGQDVVKQFDEMTLNFESMYVAFANKKQSPILH